ncbi:PAS domain-containing sensor histidine kinase [Clostridium sp. C2-6-12]|uniref:PAS domain-containing sensor histidine kinase n=1 Tax=Clostridium sp. C2-6-12 TaxID=2698832 RepID=UPI001371F001|nr:PAS domain-containing sensor histidine kinase [Clostridium sp. C2-6-12]
MESFASIRRITEPYLCSSNDIITEVNDEFVSLTGFKVGELVGRSISEIINMLKFNFQSYINNENNINNSKYSGFIFTKFLEAREVNISFTYDKEKNRQKYIFVEKLNSRLEEKFIFLDQIFKEGIWSVAIYSASDLKLLKANKSYIAHMRSPFNKYENVIGKSVMEVSEVNIHEKIASIYKSLCEKKKTMYIKELKVRNIFNRISYLDLTITPIFEEKSDMKYIIVVNNEVTDRVIKNRNIDKQKKIIEKQKEELEKKNSQLKVILENLSEGVMLSDNEGKIIMINKEAKRLTYQDEKFNFLCKPNPYIKFFDMQGREINSENMPRTKALKGEIVKNDKIMIRKCGKEYYIDNSSIPIYDENNKLDMVICCFHDITETILQSKKIQEQKEELNAIIENINEGISIFDSKRRYKLFNKAARDMFFYDNKFIDEESEIYDANGEKINLENYPSRRVIAGEKFENMDLTVRFPDRTLRIDASGIPIYNEKGEFLLGITCFKDMTNYYNQEKILKSRNEFLNRFIYNLEIPVIGLSYNELEILKINQKAFELLRKVIPQIASVTKIKGKRITDIVPNFKKSEYYKKVNEVIITKETKYLRKNEIIINGKETYYKFIFEPIFEVSGELKEILILIIDITAEVKSNMVMEKTLRLQEEFLANISHELKTPLNVIFATAQLIDMYCGNGALEEKKDCIIKYIDSIKQNSYRLSKLINNIVDLSKIEAGFFELKLSNKNIVEVVEEIVMSVTDFIKTKGLNIIFDTNTEEKVIACDVEKIERIVLNLLSNAIKFSDQGNEIFVNVKDNSEYVEISVKDNGIGIEPNDINKIFDRFKQVDKSLSRNSEGTGIGLSLVKSFVELHGGNIRVESKFGKGSNFIFNLPSRNVLENDKLCASNIRNKNDIIKVEFSDVYK